MSVYQFTYRGLTFGAGTVYGVTSVEGIDGFEVRRDDSTIPRSHGNVPGIHVVDEQPIIFHMELDVKTVTDVEAALNDFREAFRVRKIYSPTDDVLTFELPSSGIRMIRCRPIGTPVVRAASPGAHVIRLTAAFIANDPRVYSSVVRSQTLDPYYVNLGGEDLPADFDIDMDSTTAGTASTVTNLGSGDAWPTLEIGPPPSGSINEVMLVNETVDARLNIRTTVLINQLLRADMEAVETANGITPITVDGGNRYGHWVLPRLPFYLGPGANTLKLVINGSSTNVPGKLIWRDTWL